MNISCVLSKNIIWHGIWVLFTGVLNLKSALLGSCSKLICEFLWAVCVPCCIFCKQLNCRYKDGWFLYKKEKKEDVVRFPMRQLFTIVKICFFCPPFWSFELRSVQQTKNNECVNKAMEVRMTLTMMKKNLKFENNLILIIQGLCHSLKHSTKE